MSKSLVVELALLLFMGSLLAPISLADDLKIKPGRWETTTTTIVSIMPQPRTSTRTECLDGDSVDPSKWLADQGDGCEIENVSTTATTMSFDLSCTTPQGTAKGKGTYRVDGDTMSGEFDMTMQGQMSITINNKIASRWLGECDE